MGYEFHSIYVKNLDFLSRISKFHNSCKLLEIFWYTKRNRFWHPYLINTIEMEIKYVKSTARLLNRDYFNKRGLDLSKEVLWVSVGQRAPKLQAVKVVG